uniref:BURP domain-containing protein n=1 Tax=Chenopodium quinoa TaxID=63459 RepID=A0A803LBW6_CHEQI
MPLKGSTKETLASTNGYIGLLSYDNKKGLASTNGYIGLLSYDNKKELASTNGYIGLLSYDNKKALASTNGCIGLLSYGDKKELASTKATLRIELCEEPTIEGVEKKCVTSLESMVDYVISMIGTNVKALTTQVKKDSKMEYTIYGVKRLVKNDHETVVCHKMGYPYAVFFCHRTKTIRSYMASLVGKDGTKIEAVVACHMESNDFLDNYAKIVLKVVPGSTHICHFPAAEDTVIWMPK